MSSEKMNLLFKKLKAKMKPILKSNANPSKAPTEIQKRFPSKLNPRLSSVFCPIVMFDVGRTYQQQERKAVISENELQITVFDLAYDEIIVDINSCQHTAVT